VIGINNNEVSITDARPCWLCPPVLSAVGPNQGPAGYSSHNVVNHSQHGVGTRLHYSSYS
jgi:hypothetical protein